MDVNVGDGVVDFELDPEEESVEDGVGVKDCENENV